MNEWKDHLTLLQAEMGPVPSANRDAWLESRTSSIGASESGAACGRSKWEQPYDIWARKTGRRGEVEETAAMRLGTYLEPYVIGEYARQTGLSMLYVDTDMPILRSKKHNWLTATPDALVSTPFHHHSAFFGLLLFFLLFLFFSVLFSVLFCLSV